MKTPRIEELKDYKEPTQLNGTDYYRLPVNKIEHIIAEAHQAGKKAGIDEAVEILKEAKKKANKEITREYSEGVYEGLCHAVHLLKALQDNK